MLAEDRSPLTSDTFPHNISSSSTSTQRADVLEKPARWQILTHSESYFGQQQIISMPKYMQLLPCAGLSVVRVSLQWDSPHCDRVQRHHCRGERTPSWHMAVGPSPLHMAVQVRSHFHTRPNTHRQTEGDWVSEYAYISPWTQGEGSTYKKRVTESQMGLKLWEGDLKKERE